VKTDIICAPGGERALTTGETALVQSVFGDRVDADRVRIRRRRWFPLQPRNVTMAPCGHIHFHPRSPDYRDDFAAEWLPLKGLFIHEMAHVWQVQQHGRFYLVLRRHPFCRYDYTLRPGWELADYGLEQQAEIIRHAFLISHYGHVASAPDQAAISELVRDAMADR
jgi:hypothetical protein